MALQLGDEAPDFTADSTAGPIHFHEFIGDGWCILFSHPKDYTPVCTTELGFMAQIQDQFTQRECKILAVSVDPVEDHQGWIGDIEETQSCSVGYPLLADPDRIVATLYGMIHPKADNTLTVRSVFIIGPDKKVKLMITYPASTGRNFHEILRALDSLQLTANHKVATPVNWEDGGDCIVLPSITNEEADALFPKGYEVVKPYLRTTPQPNR